MAQVLGKNSSYISKKLWRNALFYCFATLVFIAGVFICYILANQVYAPENPAGKGLLFLLYLTALFFITKVIIRVFHMDFFYRGGIGENLVASELAKLPSSYLVFRNVHVDGRLSDTDFIVLGPKGLLIVEAKSHGGNISFNGYELLRNGRPFEKDFLRQAKIEAMDLEKYLEKYGFKGFVKPVLVFSSRYARMNFGLHPQSNVFVIQKAWLTRLILSLPDVSYNLHQTELENILADLVK